MILAFIFSSNKKQDRIMEYFPKQPFWTTDIKDFESRTVAPNGALAQFYNFTASPEEDQTFTAVPDGTVDIFFRCSDTDPSAMVYGSVLKGKVISLKKNAHYFGVRFFPGAAKQVLGCPLDLFTDQDIPMVEVQDCAEELVECISQSESFEERIALFAEFQSACCGKYKEQPELVSWLMNRINKAGGNIRIKALADESGYTSRYVNKIFKQHVGVSPKFFERVVRFQNCLSLMNENRNADYTELAYDAGYYDQAHFINEFKEFSLSTPSRVFAS